MDYDTAIDNLDQAEALLAEAVELILTTMRSLPLSEREMKNVVKNPNLLGAVSMMAGMGNGWEPFRPFEKGTIEDLKGLVADHHLGENLDDEEE